jgi:hypothetical protein
VEGKNQFRNGWKGVGDRWRPGEQIFPAISGIRSFAGCCMDQTQLALTWGVGGIAEWLERIVLDRGHKPHTLANVIRGHLHL